METEKSTNEKLQIFDTPGLVSTWLTLPPIYIIIIETFLKLYDENTEPIVSVYYVNVYSCSVTQVGDQSKIIISV